MKFKKFIAFALSVVVFLSLSIPAFAEAGNGETTQTPLNVTSGLKINSIKTSEMESLNYYLKVPENPVENMPLIVYLHSSGMAKSDEIEEILRTEEGASYLVDYIKDAFIVIPHDPQAGRQWLDREASVLELIESVAAEYKIDRTRISIMGYSGGADGIAKIAAHHPEIFSCATLISPYSPKNPRSTYTDDQTEGLAKLPLQFYMETIDGGLDTAKNVVQKITDAGGNVSLTEINTTHSSIDSMLFKESQRGVYGIVEWMLSQKKN